MTDYHQLPLTSSHWGTYRARVENGRVKELLGFEQDPDPSPIGQGMVGVQDGPLRIHAPMIRQSWLEQGPGKATHRRGIDPFVEVGWPTAEKAVARELERVRARFGNQAIYAGSYGWSSAGRFHHAQSQLHRFLNCIGGYTRSRFTYSFAAAEAMMPHVLGSFRAFLDSATSWESIIEHGELVVALGGIPLKNGQISQGGTGRHYQREHLLAASGAGLEFVNVSPVKSDLLDAVDGDWLPIRPNTDVALLLGIAHTLYSEALHDAAFLDTYTVGFERFIAYVTGSVDGRVRDADWAAAICEIPAEAIRTLARRMAKSRTMLSMSFSLTRQDHGEQPFWAGIAVAAMLGQVGLPAGGFAFGYSAMNYIGAQFTVPPGVALPQGDNPVGDFIPVARISDLLLEPGESFDFDGGTYVYPDIRLVYWAGGNPFHHHQDLNRLLQAWEKPETVIVNEWCWNALAKRADIVLPCTTPLERNDIALTPRDPYVVAMSRLTEPHGSSRDDYRIFRGIAREMGVEDAFSEGRSEADWIRWIWDRSRELAAASNIELPDYDQLREKGWHCIDPPAEQTIMLRRFREDPRAHPLETPSGKIEIYSETVAAFGYDDCPGHPAWLEPLEWLGMSEPPFPLHLISNQPADKLHSQLDHGKVSRANKVDEREPLHMHPLDAGRRNLAGGEVVKVFNDRGTCLAGLVVDPNVRPGVVRMSTGSWYDPLAPEERGSPCKHGNPNVLTPDKGTSKLGQGPIAHTCLVEVAKFEGDPPRVTAFEPPEMKLRENGNQG